MPSSISSKRLSISIRHSSVLPLVSDRHDHERMRVDELKLADGALHRHALAAVVDGRDRVMGPGWRAGPMARPSATADIHLVMASILYSVGPILARRTLRARIRSTPSSISTRISRESGGSGPLEPTLETLAGLARAHISSIPFENVDVLLGRGIRIDLDSIHAKLVTARRGGYCFEHGTLFQAALDRLGFQTTAHAARVLTIVPRHQAARTHMF